MTTPDPDPTYAALVLPRDPHPPDHPGVVMSTFHVLFEVPSAVEVTVKADDMEAAEVMAAELVEGHLETLGVPDSRGVCVFASIDGIGATLVQEIDQ